MSIGLMGWWEIDGYKPIWNYIDWNGSECYCLHLMGLCEITPIHPKSTCIFKQQYDCLQIIFAIKT